MSVSAIILRVVLSMVLILNGMGSVAASVHVGHTGPKLMEAPAFEPVEMPCHGEHQDADAAGEPPSAGLVLGEGAPSQSQPDCCNSLGCQCACVHHGQPAVPAYAWPDASNGQASVVLPLKSGHTAPVLPHLIRPPIG